MQAHSVCRVFACTECYLRDLIVSLVYIRVGSRPEFLLGSMPAIPKLPENSTSCTQSHGTRSVPATLSSILPRRGAFRNRRLLFAQRFLIAHEALGGAQAIHFLHHRRDGAAAPDSSTLGRSPADVERLASVVGIRSRNPRMRLISQSHQLPSGLTRGSFFAVGSKEERCSGQARAWRPRET